MQRLTEKNAEVLTLMLKYHENNSEFSNLNSEPMDAISFHEGHMAEFTRTVNGAHGLWGLGAPGFAEESESGQRIDPALDCFLSALSFLRILEYYTQRTLRGYEQVYAWTAWRVENTAVVPVNHNALEAMALCYDFMHRWLASDASYRIKTSLRFEEEDTLEIDGVEELLDTLNYLVLACADLILQICNLFPEERSYLIERLA